MDPDNTALLHSVRRWLMTVAFALGVCVVAVAALGYRVAPFANPLVFSVAGVAGGVVATVAGLRLAGSLARLLDGGNADA